MSRRALFAGLLATGIATDAAGEPLVDKAGDQPNGVFDILRAEVRREPEREQVLFRMEVSGRAGASRPQKMHEVAGAAIFAYLWPLSVDPAAVGFKSGAGTLALALTLHPDFDDTPAHDENGNGDFTDDVEEWHPHWLVLQSDSECRRSGLKVAELPPDAAPKPPAPSVQASSPGYAFSISGGALEVRVPAADLPGVSEASFDGLTASLRVNPRLASPLWCVGHVLDVASERVNLPGPGKVE